MTICPHFRAPEEHATCAAGVNYLSLAGGGVHNMVLRLPCLPLSNRRGEVAGVCQLLKRSNHAEQ